MIKFPKILLLAILVLSACSSEDSTPGGGEVEDSFDRKALLTNWADNIIIPAFSNFKNSTQALEEKAAAFAEAPTETALQELRTAFEKAYLDFQTVSMFQIGEAQMLSYRNFLNTYPTDAQAIESNISTGDYDLVLPSTFAEQGFPALDYLINGLGASDAEITSAYDSEGLRQYLLEVSARINSLTAKVNSSWQQGDFKETFINNTSSSSTGSVDRLTNDYVMYFEKFLRSGKIGYPAGVFSGEPSPVNAEAYYSKGLSKELYLKALESVRDFFNGKHFGSSQSGPGFADYLDYMKSKTDGVSLSGIINDQFSLIFEESTGLAPSLREQVEQDNVKMLQVYDELQKMVVLLKVDMTQALSISIDYVDSDGD